MARPRRRAAIAFMAVWLVLWGAGMLVALWMAGAAAARGAPAPALFLTLWTLCAGAGLYAGVRRMQRLLGIGDATAQARPGPHAWDDGLSERRDG